ncbi:MAG: glycoside hydrolase family 20 zincin-like fold domain-containing protein, partial [Tannerella sp.]|nr:glycoside hydrolase family 20 zincin-like fold domain-containing protein [Tannerella sp.]
FYMKKNIVISLGLIIVLSSLCYRQEARETVRIVGTPKDNAMVDFATRELQRYLYLRTGTLAVTGKSKKSASAKTILLSVDSGKLAPEEYEIETQDPVLTVCGGSATGLLYGIYRLAEHWGIRFYLHGDVIPDRKIPFVLPQIREKGKPLFALRGLNPWGSHPHGFDQWSADDYIVHIGQLTKMRMNFIGIHCYPEGLPYAEPTVWIGEEKDIRPDGTVAFGYPAHYYSTAIMGNWGKITPGETESYLFGSSQLFPEKHWEPEVMQGLPAGPQTPEESNLLFNRTGRQFSKAFTFARSVGVKTCIGTETPMTIPKLVRERMVAEGKNPDDAGQVKEIYKAIFRRIQATHPLDYYWLWTEESWTWRGNSREATDRVIDDIVIASQALDEIGRPFELATAGWVVGPVEDRALLDRKLPPSIPLSSISRDVGHVAVDSAYRQIKRAGKWAIPWMESDHYHGLNNPQIFVSRIRNDAADALAYGCNGLMGLHWRTEELSPNIAALAQAAWNQDAWNPTPGQQLPEQVKKPLFDGQSNRGMESIDFWRDWAENMFGQEIAEEAAQFFHSIDGNLPISVQKSCPGGSLSPDSNPWETVQKRFAFVDDFCRLRSRVSSAGNQERFEFWQNFLLYYRQQAQVRCTLGKFYALTKEIESENEDITKKNRAEKELLPLFGELTQQYGAMSTFLQETVTTNGGLMEIVFMEQFDSWRKTVWDNPKQKLEKLMGRPVGAAVDAWKEYRGKPRIFIPTLRTVAFADEKVMLPVKIHSPKPPVKAVLYWKELGANTTFRKVELLHLGKSNYQVTLPFLGQNRKAIEYYIEATFEGNSMRFPSTAPELNQTVIWFPQSK